MPTIRSGSRLFGDRGGLLGSGIPGYARHQGYTASRIPTAVGARYFAGLYDSTGDHEVPIAKGNKWDGGKLAYQQKVYNAAKRDHKELGFSSKDMTDLSKMPGVTGPGV